MARKIKKIGAVGGRMEDEQSGIEFSDGTFLVDVHIQDCCEHVYADWDHLKDEAGILNEDFTDLRISLVRNKGFMLVGQHYSYFVPCYNEQNGYYNSALGIVLYKPVNRRRTRCEILLSYGDVPTEDNIY